MSLSSSIQAHLFNQRIVDALPNIEPDPKAIVAIDGLPVGEVDG